MTACDLLHVVPRIQYMANTQPGSSGSPCFTVGWNLVVMLHGGETNAILGIPMNAILGDLHWVGKGGILGAAS